MQHSSLRKNYSVQLHNLHKLKNFGKKFEVLMALHRHSKPMKEHELEIWGIPFILNGLAYHFKRFKLLEKKQSSGNTTKTQFCHTVNELTAYLNRLGQMYACVTSKWFDKYVTSDKLPILCPFILALIPFRNKYSAHSMFRRRQRESSSQLESFSNIDLIVTNGPET